MDVQKSVLCRHSRRNSIASELEVYKKPDALLPRKNSAPADVKNGISPSSCGRLPLCGSRTSTQPPRRRFSVAAANNVDKEMAIPPSPFTRKMQELRHSVRSTVQASQLIDRAAPVFHAKRLEDTFNAVWDRLEAKYGEDAMRFPEEIVWLGGAPGAGKGTQSKFLASCRGIAADPIVMSSLLESPEAKRIKSQGGMVSDEVVLEALLEQLRKPQYRDGAVVDGFPRTDQQVKFVKLLYSKLRETRTSLFRVVILHVDESESIRRQLARGHSIKAQNKLRSEKGLPLLEQRDTDCSKEYAHKRYRIFMEQLASVLALKKDFQFTFIDASGTVDQVQQSIHDEMVPYAEQLNALLTEVNRCVRDQAKKPVMAY